MNTATKTFRIPTAPTFGDRLLDLIDHNPITSIRLIVAAAAGLVLVLWVVL